MEILEGTEVPGGTIELPDWHAVYANHCPFRAVLACARAEGRRVARYRLPDIGGPDFQRKKGQGLGFMVMPRTVSQLIEESENFMTTLKSTAGEDRPPVH